MNEEELEKMLKELPTGSASITNISGGVIGMDFASLYPSTMTVSFPSRQSRRKKKISKIFD